MSTASEINVRRIVTGHTPDGRSVVRSDGRPPRIVQFERLPGLTFIELWATEGVPRLPAAGEDPTLEMTSFVPGPESTRFILVQFPPRPTGLPAEFDARAALEELSDKAPGEWHWEPEAFGMHTTETVDYVCVLSGELTLLLDDGTEVPLRSGDCVVQNGTRHGWRNAGTEPAVLVAVLVGASRAA
jgi:mannose-6-phosphate isomerase-like protein (cupin superfamily)